MKLLDWLHGRHSRDTREALTGIGEAIDAQIEARKSAEARQKDSLERDLLRINGLLRDGSSKLNR